MDMMMPGLKGTHSHPHDQGRAGTGGNPGVLISALPEEKHAFGCRVRERMDFIAKPFYREGLLEVVRRYLPEARCPGVKAPR